MPHTRSGRIALTFIAALGLGSATLVAAAPAHAANWTTIMATHKGKTQLCKDAVAGGWTVRIRLDNRASTHAHLAGMSRNQGANVTVRAQAGEVSKVKSLFVQTGDALTVGMGELTGEGAGGRAPLGSVGFC
jgi:hypothetical protein